MEVPQNGSMQSTHGMNLNTFAKRLQALYLHWHQHKDELWGSADIFAVATPPPADINYLKSSLLIKWLLGYEVPETIMLFGFKQIHFLCLQEDRLLETMVKGTVDVDVFIHRKLRGEAATSDMDYVLHSMCNSNSEVLDGPVVGHIINESHEGSLLEKWVDNIKRRGLQLSDVTDGLSDFLAINMPDEQSYENEEIQRQHRVENAGRLVRGDSSENKVEPITVSSVCIYPHFGGSQSVITGVLEAHDHSFRYSSPGRDEQVNILYANIKHAFFQPQEMLVVITLIHFHLHDPITVGNKKTKDVQFLREEMRVLKTLAGEKILNFDLNEIIECQKLWFDCEPDLQSFVERVSCIWQCNYPDLKFEQPLHEFGFVGRVEPNKASAFIAPTSSCLIELVCTPFLVIPLSEIELVNLERVGILGQTTFDMAIVLKDSKRDVMRINAIPFECYGYIIKWLESSRVKHFESRMNIHWCAIKKTFTDDPQAFIDVGGWDFLNREKEIPIDDGGGFVSLDLAGTRAWPFCVDFGDYLDETDYVTECYELSDAYPMLNFYNVESDTDCAPVEEKVEEGLDEKKKGMKTWEGLDWEASENADIKENRRIKKNAFGMDRAGSGISSPKWKLLKRVAFGKMRVGPLFSTPKRRIMKKAFFGKGRTGHVSSALLVGKKVEECLDEQEPQKTWEGVDREAYENAFNRKERRIKKAFGKERAGPASSASKRLKLM